jgi:hypothetical protein
LYLSWILGGNGHAGPVQTQKAVEIGRGSRFATPELESPKGCMKNNTVRSFVFTQATHKVKTQQILELYESEMSKIL